MDASRRTSASRLAPLLIALCATTCGPPEPKQMQRAVITVPAPDLQEQRAAKLQWAVAALHCNPPSMVLLPYEDDHLVACCFDFWFHHSGALTCITADNECVVNPKKNTDAPGRDR